MLRRGEVDIFKLRKILIFAICMALIVIAVLGVSLVIELKKDAPAPPPSQTGQSNTLPQGTNLSNNQSGVPNPSSPTSTGSGTGVGSSGSGSSGSGTGSGGTPPPPTCVPTNNGVELCDGIDNNCNNQIDEGLAQTFYKDEDTDTYGDPLVTVQVCSQPNTYVANAGDCDDTNIAIHPNANELCDDGIDQDCDGIDPSCPPNDNDQDGYAPPADCDDTNAQIHPGAIELCNSFDDDCDLQIDETFNLQSDPFNCGQCGFTCALNVCVAGTCSFSLADAMVPNGRALAGQNTVAFTGGNYVFSYSEGGQLLTQYRINPTSTNVQKGLLYIYEALSDSYPVVAAGTSYRKLDNAVISPSTYSVAATTNAFTHTLIGNTLQLHYTQTYEGVTLQKQYDIAIDGKTLVITVQATDPSQSPNGNYAGVQLDRTESTENPVSIQVPYMGWAPITKFDPGYFMSSYIDTTKSSANKMFGTVGTLYPSSPQTSIYNSYSVRYDPGENNRYQPLDETAYITVSDTLEDLFIKNNNLPSPYRQDLNKRVIFDNWRPYTWSQLQGANFFAKLKDLTAILYDYGMEDIAITVHIWSLFGYDCGYPSFYPANQNYGGSTGIIDAITTAQNYGYKIALHENYYQFHQNSLVWDPANIAHNPDGTLTFGEVEVTCPGYTQSYLSAPDKRLPLAINEATIIKENYGVDATYLDVTTSAALDKIDYNSGSPAFTLKDTYLYVMQLNNQHKNKYQGPLFGEGKFTPASSHTMQAGLVDGIEAEIMGGDYSLLIPDFELRQIKPLMANQGMGYQGRWASHGTYPQVTNINPSTFNFDHYRAWQIAYAHTGFMGEATFGGTGATLNNFMSYWVKEYYLFRVLQEQYLAEDVISILYQNPVGDMVDLSEALKQDLDFQNSQLKITYGNGLTIYVNGHQSQLWPVTYNSITHYLPPNGWLFASQEKELFGYSALVDANSNPSPAGTRADFLYNKDYMLVDGRGSMINFGSDYTGQDIVFNRLKIIKPNGFTLAQNTDNSFTLTPGVQLSPEEVRPRTLIYVIIVLLAIAVVVLLILIIAVIIVQKKVKRAMVQGMQTQTVSNKMQ